MQSLGFVPWHSLLKTIPQEIKGSVQKSLSCEFAKSLTHPHPDSVLPNPFLGFTLLDRANL